MNLFATKPLSLIQAESEGGQHTLIRTLGAPSLVMLGIGAIIGAGLFSLTGIAAAENAGPAVVISFLVAALGCAFAGLCYSEFATMIPIAGSAYTYAYATMGEFLAWIIGWDLVLEYAVGSATVSISWSAYVVSFLHDLGIELPAKLIASPWQPVKLADGSIVHGLINLPAVFIVVLISLLLMTGIRESARVNAVIVVIKVAVVLVFIAVGFGYIKSSNYTPFIPENSGVFGEFGWSGIMRAAGVIFFAYIGFESVSTAAQETINPQRNMPIGILGALGICTVLYILMCLVITGVVPYTDPGLAEPRPIYTVVDAMGPSFTWLKFVVTIGATIGLGSTILVLLYGQSRIFYAMARDGLLPPAFGSVDPRRRTPVAGTALTAIVGGLMAGLFPIGLLGELVSVGTLLAFAMICAGTMYLRIRHPELPRAFKTPVLWLTAPLGIASCAYLIASLPVATFWRLLIWMGLGLVIYATYAYWHSRYHEAAVVAPQGQNPTLS